MDFSLLENTPGVYIIQSLKNHRFYIGSTSHFNTRLNYHNSGKVKATKNLAPWELRFFQVCPDITNARKLEYGLKKLKRKDYIEGVIRDQKIQGVLTKWL